MNLNKKVRLVLILTGILVLLFAITTAGAQPKAEAVVTLSADQSLYAADQAVIVHVTFSNPTNHTIRILKWYTPVDGVEEPLFSVSVGGAPVAYTGPIYKRPPATGQDFISLKAGESFTSDVALGLTYDLSASGAYSIVYDVSSWNLTSEKGGGPDQSVETLTSNTLLLGIEGRQAPSLFDSAAPDAVSGASTFTKCTASQQSSLVSARTEASTYSANALAYLNAGTQGLRYTTWFGTYLASRYNTVKTHFGSISSAMDNAPVDFNCGCKKKYYAYVYANQPYKIYLCSVFWTAPLTGTDSKAGTLIHEMSHFTVVAGTNDYVYGQAGAKSLAISNPNNAVNNADNHEYFAENTPAQP
jgi:peptidyl-Lys metalloendopeptidase